MKFSRSIILAGVLALGLSVAFGQGAGARGGPGGPGGQGGRQGGGFGLRGGPRLLLNEAVQKELKMTPAQIKKAQGTFGSQGGGGGLAVPGNRGSGGAAQGGRGGAGATGQGGRGGGGQGGGQPMTPEQREQRRLETEKQIKGILNAKQFERYSQVTLQMQGPGALARKDVAAKVGLSAKQVDQIQKVQQAQMEALRNAFQNGGGQGSQGGAQSGRGGAQGGGSTDQMRQQFTKMREQTNSKILAVLSPAQKQKWQSLQGAPFKMPQSGGR